MGGRTTIDRNAILLLLMAIAGAVDAIGLAETGGAFVSFMSGNTTKLGLGLAYGDWRAALPLVGLIALFVGGTTAGALIAERARRPAGVLLLIEAVLLALAWSGLNSERPAWGVALLPPAMGLANVVLIDRRGKSPGVTYATGALVRIGIGLAGLGRDRDNRALFLDIGLWLALAGGAVFGSIGRLRYGAAALLAMAAALVLLAIVELATPRALTPVAKPADRP